jgi:lysophospholipase L1-like esterase
MDKMKNIKKFTDFINEAFLDNQVLSTFGSIITNTKDYSYSQSPSVVSYGNPGSTNKTLVPLKNTDPKNILFIGDSHTAIKSKAGKAVTYTFPNILKKELEPKGYKIDVLALGGMTTQWMLDNLPSQLKNKKYDRVYIYGGANDAANSSITLEKALSNIQKMVDLSRNNGADVFVNQGYIIEGESGNFGNWKKMSISGTLLKKQEEWIPYIERKKELQRRIPLEIKNSNFISPYDLKGLTSDGIHANSEGQKMVAKIFSDSIKNTSSSSENYKSISSPRVGPAGKSIVIGDSLSPNVAKCSQADLISSTSGPSSLWKGGIAIGTLLDYVKSYGKTDSTVKNVVISIGTNGIYGRSTDTVNKLMDELKKKFPNAKVLVVKGTYGPKATWSPALTKVSQTTVDNYYSDFSNKGAFVVPTAIGNQKDAHAYTDIYTTIGKEIDANLS